MSGSDVLVLDAGALIALSSVEGALTTPEVVEEARSRNALWNLRSLLSAGLDVSSPSQESVSRVRAAAEDTGDGPKLSDADVSVLALALERGGTLLSDDYSIQNVAALLGVTCRGVEQKGIARALRWEWLCRKCKGRMDGPGECPVCGGDGYRRVAR